MTIIAKDKSEKTRQLSFVALRHLALKFPDHFISAVAQGRYPSRSGHNAMDVYTALQIAIESRNEAFKGLRMPNARR